VRAFGYPKEKKRRKREGGKDQINRYKAETKEQAAECSSERYR